MTHSRSLDRLGRHFNVSAYCLISLLLLPDFVFRVTSENLLSVPNRLIVYSVTNEKQRFFTFLFDPLITINAAIHFPSPSLICLSEQEYTDTL